MKLLSKKSYYLKIVTSRKSVNETTAKKFTAEAEETRLSASFPN